MLSRLAALYALLAGLTLAAFIALPVASVFARLDWGGLTAALRSPLVAQALGLSAFTTFVSTLIVVAAGTPLAYLLARRRFRGKEVLDTLLDLPLVLPPAVAGLALLMAFGRRGLLGPYLAQLGLALPFTTAAVILAQCFVSSPFYIKTARSGFAAVDPRLEQIALTLGQTPAQVFRRVTLPLALPALLAGAIMAWARSLGEFGATIMFAGSLPGVTQTLPLAVYAALERDLNAALVIAALMLFVSFLVLLLVKILTRREA